MTIEIKTRPIVEWPGVLTQDRDRVFADFNSTYTQTMQLLRRELHQLGAKEAVVELAYTETDFRLDGSLRARATKPAHPGVIFSFDSRHGPLRYFTDIFKARYHGQEDWHMNLRAIALGLEALRRIDRYGIANRAEQYTGWKAIGSGIALSGPQEFTPPEAAAIIAGGSEHYTAADVIATAETERLAYRESVKVLHPDASNDTSEIATEKFKQLQTAHQVMVEYFERKARRS